MATNISKEPPGSFFRVEEGKILQNIDAVYSSTRSYIPEVKLKLSLPMPRHHLLGW